MNKVVKQNYWSWDLHPLDETGRNWLLELVEEDLVHNFYPINQCAVNQKLTTITIDLLIPPKIQSS